MFLALGLCGCSAKSLPSAAAVRSVTIALSRCFGRCPHWQATITKEGKGKFHGILDTAVTGFRDFALTPTQTSAFVQELERVRPTGAMASNENRDCVTDSQYIDVFWTMANGATQQLHFYKGCSDGRAKRTRAILERAIGILPIADLIQER